MIKEIKDRTLPGIGRTEDEVKENFLLHYVWELADAVSYENPIIKKFFDYESEEDLKHKAEVLERIYNKHDVSEEELISILELYPKPEPGMDLFVKW